MTAIAACLLLSPFVGGLAVIGYEWWGITRLPVLETA